MHIEGKILVTVGGLDYIRECSLCHKKNTNGKITWEIGEVCDECFKEKCIEKIEKDIKKEVMLFVKCSECIFCMKEKRNASSTSS